MQPENVHTLGNLFRKLKAEVKLEGEKSQGYVKENISYITLRTVQQCMCLAKNVNLEFVSIYKPSIRRISK